jgi:hypothetical protein
MGSGIGWRARFVGFRCALVRPKSETLLALVGRAAARSSGLQWPGEGNGKVGAACGLPGEALFILCLALVSWLRPVWSPKQAMCRWVVQLLPLVALLGFHFRAMTSGESSHCQPLPQWRFGGLCQVRTFGTSPDGCGALTSAQPHVQSCGLR